MLRDNSHQYASHECISMLDSEVTSIQHILSGAKFAFNSHLTELPCICLVGVGVSPLEKVDSDC